MRRAPLVGASIARCALAGNAVQQLLAGSAENEFAGREWPRPAFKEETMKYHRSLLPIIVVLSVRIKIIVKRR
jgi:hypothetical protein